MSALYQLLYLRVPTHATVHENVTAAKILGMARAAPLVNAILRRTIRERDSLVQILDESEVGRYAYPPWWINEVKADWPGEWEPLLLAGNTRAPMTLRVNLTRMTRNAYQRELTAAGFSALDGSIAPTAIRLDRPCAVDHLPGFAAGWVSVQDEAAQLATPFLDPQPGMRVLDACSAPGGKTAHLLEYTEGNIQLDAVDNDPERLRRVHATIQRIGCGTARLIPADATCPEEFFTGDPYDRILLDAPCSGSGIVRRHPDIKITRTRTSVERAQTLQARLLEAIWPLLGVSGRLLYVTCSIFECENDRVIGSFIARHPDAVCEGFPDNRLAETKFGVASRTGRDECDGFYFARLQKSG
ncbi:sun protein [mine drainage metagenome]|uniref:16S rRNA (cytosine(967)-C(5))-methyltransferase n=1 Tax=mine drainage metagenome TaxID=410659 RepID=T1BKU6_9ZZZZ